MNELENVYRILELTPGASAEEARKAYKQLVVVWHPSGQESGMTPEPEPDPP